MLMHSFNTALTTLKLAQSQTNLQIQLNDKGKTLRLPVSVRALSLTLRSGAGDIQGECCIPLVRTNAQGWQLLSVRVTKQGVFIGRLHLKLHVACHHNLKGEGQADKDCEVSNPFYRGKVVDEDFQDLARLPHMDDDRSETKVIMTYLSLATEIILVLTARCTYAVKK